LRIGAERRYEHPALPVGPLPGDAPSQEYPTMRLTGARIYLVESGGIRPVLLELETDAGITGLGEASVAYGVGATAAAGMLKDIIGRFLTRDTDPFRIESLWS
jgi:galactonate dehydratase